MCDEMTWTEQPQDHIQWQLAISEVTKPQIAILLVT